MLKKHFGGLILFIFTFIFGVPLFLGVDTSDAGPTIVMTQDWLTEFYCPDGTYVTYLSGKHVNEYYHGHPEDECHWVYHDHDEWCFIWCFGNRWVEVCQHRTHDTISHHNSTLDYTRVTLWNNTNYCK